LRIAIPNGFPSIVFGLAWVCFVGERWRDLVWQGRCKFLAIFFGVWLWFFRLLHFLGLMLWVAFLFCLGV
jgi:hypothetical protein